MFCVAYANKRTKRTEIPPQPSQVPRTAELRYEDLPYSYREEINPSSHSVKELLERDPDFVHKVDRAWWSWNNCDDE
jgi:hypothetical protein